MTSPESSLRQEEWRKVLNKDKIEENVEDLRPLSVRLKEQQDIKAKEASKIIICGDNEDAEHIKNVSEMKFFMENKIRQEDSHEIDEFRRKAAKLQEEEMKKKARITLLPKKPLKPSTVNKQKMLLMSGIKRKLDHHKLEKEQ